MHALSLFDRVATLRTTTAPAASPSTAPNSPTKTSSWSTPGPESSAWPMLDQVICFNRLGSVLLCLLLALDRSWMFDTVCVLNSNFSKCLKSKLVRILDTSMSFRFSASCKIKKNHCVRPYKCSQTNLFAIVKKLSLGKIFNWEKLFHKFLDLFCYLVPELGGINLAESIC